jgi:L-ascorbate metabolism protein UlaG (beta-lactamase superfamily)
MKAAMGGRPSPTPGGFSMASLAAAGGFARRAAPALWDRYSQDRRREILPAPNRPRWKEWRDRGLHAAWIGHSTVLLKVDGYTILTDPVFSDRCGIRVGPITVGLKRLVAPALKVPHLPPIDLVLLSHAHMDHFDIPSLRALEHRGVTVVTARTTSDLLRVRRYGAVHEVGWGEHVRVGPFTIRGVQVNHWGARLRTDTYRGYNGYLIETDRYRVLFGGDTADTRVFRTLRTSRPVNLAIMPIGAYNPWIHAHCTPEQAVRMADEAGAERLLPIHHQTFQLSREPVHEPIERCLEAAHDASRVVTQQIGEEASL